MSINIYPLFLPKTLFCCLLAIWSAGLVSQTVSVEVRTLDADTQAPLGFVNLQVEGTSQAATTDENGEYTFNLPTGKVVFLASFVGYAEFRREVNLTANTRLNFQLRPIAEQLETIVVSDMDASQRIERPLMGVERLSIAEIEALPVALGEVDVFRGLQLLSGVSSAGEASNGLSVRGGTVDQNLVLLDGAPIFTPTHLFGLFSVFTPDAIGSVDLYRANVPARYGGRIASVVDVRSRVPNTDKFKMQGGIGIVSSHLSVETPLTKDKKLQLLVAGRGGFNDFVFGLVEELKNTRSWFTDGTAKLRYRANDKNIFTLSGFYSKDFYQIDLLNSFGGVVAQSNQYDYYTFNGTAEWLKIINDKTSWQTRVVSSDHLPKILFPQEDTDFVVEYGSRIRYKSLQTTIDRVTDNGHHFSGGIQLADYLLNPGELNPGGSSAVRPITLERERGLEASAFVEDEWTVSDALTLSIGLRYTQFAQVGPGEQRRYREGAELTEDALLESERFDGGAVMQSYGGLEPRVGLSFKLNPRTSFKAAYARNRQYLQNIFNATTPLPTSRWKVSDNHVAPQTADLFSAGIFRILGQGRFEFSLEGYYRSISDLLEYKPGADFFLNPEVETDIIQGEGQAYGVEVGLRKRRGKLTGQVNYTYARSRNRVQGTNFATTINQGEWYNGYFDQPHTFNSSLTLDDGSTHRISLNFTLQSNRPYTVPNGFLNVEGLPVPLFLERNNARMPTYHRLDFSWTIHNPKMEKRRWVGDWTLTVYNLYGRNNAYNIYYQPRQPGSPSNIFGSSPLGSYRLTIFGAPIVSLTYSFKFE